LSKLRLAEARVLVPIAQAHAQASHVLQAKGCGTEHAKAIVDHLIDVELCGLESHGIMRVLQYADEFRRGYLVANVVPNVTAGSSATMDVDGAGGIGILAMNATTYAGINVARKLGVAAFAVRDIGHTGRLGTFAERAADAG
jgi:uncharacterized oxidoreductase